MNQELIDLPEVDKDLSDFTYLHLVGSIPLTVFYPIQAFPTEEKAKALIDQLTAGKDADSFDNYYTIEQVLISKKDLAEVLEEKSSE